MVDQIQQHQRLRRRRIVPDAQPLRLEFLVARLRDIARELALETLGRRFRRGHDQQPSRIGRQFGVEDVDVLSQIEGRRRARHIAFAQFLGIFFAYFGLIVQPLQGRERTHLHVAQVVGLRRFVRVLFRLDEGGRRRNPAAEIMHEPIITGTETQQAAVRGELRRRFVLRRPRDLPQAAAADVANEDVAVADECRALAGIVENRRSIRVRHCLRFDDAIFAVRDIDTVQIDDGRAAAFGGVVNGAPVGGPINIPHCRPDPVGLRHDFFERDGVLGAGCGRRNGCCGHCADRGEHLERQGRRKQARFHERDSLTQRPYRAKISVSPSALAFTLKPMEAAVASAGKSSFGTFSAYSRKW